MKDSSINQNDSHFDFTSFEAEAIKKLYAGEELSDVLRPLISKIINKSLEGELNAYLDHPKNARSNDGNYRNGSSKKNVKSSQGMIEINIPRDRFSSFNPELVKKHQRNIGHSLENKILSLYSLGMSYRDITSHIQELYGIELSEGQLTAITDKIWTELVEWRSRPLDKLYPFVFMDAMFFKVKDEGKVVPKALYIVLGINQKGYKEILGIYVCESEGARFWLSVLTDLSNRGVKDILIASIDNLKGFSEAIESIFPRTEVQLCVIHQIRNSLRYVASKDQKEFMKDLKDVYKADTKELAEQNLNILDDKWNRKYPIVIKSWNANWDRLSRYFDYPKLIQKTIYTTNIIEGLNRQIRKVTKTKGAFVSEKALLKQIYLVLENVSSKWTQPIQNWSLTLSQLSIKFKERLELDLNINF